MEFDTGDTSVASGSEWAAPVPEAIADGCLPLFCFLAAGGLPVKAESLAERLAGITAKRTQIKAETEALLNKRIKVRNCETSKINNDNNLEGETSKVNITNLRAKPRR